MKLSKETREKALILLQQGYSAKSISKSFNAAYNINSNPSDFIILAKKNNIQIGTKDLTQEKPKIKDVAKALPAMMENPKYKKQIITSAILVISIIAALISGSILAVNYFKTAPQEDIISNVEVTEQVTEEVTDGVTDENVEENVEEIMQESSEAEKN